MRFCQICAWKHCQQCCGRVVEISEARHGFQPEEFLVNVYWLLWSDCAASAALESCYVVDG
eukprot:1123818-Amphidinium_carterae.1